MTLPEFSQKMSSKEFAIRKYFEEWKIETAEKERKDKEEMADLDRRAEIGRRRAGH